MKSNWLWSSWLHLVLGLLILLEWGFIRFVLVMIVPKFQKLLSDGLLEYDEFVDKRIEWMPELVDRLAEGGFSYFMLSALAVLILMEIAIRGDFKATVRLAAWLLLALVLFVVAAFISLTLMVGFTLALPAMGTLARPYAYEKMATIRQTLETSRKTSDWPAREDQLAAMQKALKELKVGPALLSLRTSHLAPGVPELREAADKMGQRLEEARTALVAKDAEHWDQAMLLFRIEFRTLENLNP